ncbi:MAG: nucleoside triphosphate pyrophosphohydrolase [Methylocella sp.]
MSSPRNIQSLLDIMAALRSPETGCSWDIAQTFETIIPYTIEEAYEVADAIERRDMQDLRDELGDLLLQVVFHARIAEEKGDFDFDGVVEAITQKMIRRHPHVFGDAKGLSADEVQAIWARIKSEEKSAKRAASQAAGETSHSGILEDVPLALPGLTRAIKLQTKASSVGFDWNDIRLVLDKIREETAEIEAALDLGELDAVQDALEDEIGDLLFAVANLARHAQIDPESAIRRSNAKFERRFGFIEQSLVRQGVPAGGATLDDMDALWNEAKAEENLRQAVRPPAQVK